MIYANYCCGEAPNITYTDEVLWANPYMYSHPAYYEIKCPTCHRGVHVDDYSIKLGGRTEALNRAIDLWNAGSTAITD